MRGQRARVRGEFGCTRTASLSAPSGGIAVMRGGCVCVCLHLSKVVASLRESGCAR